MVKPETMRAIMESEIPDVFADASSPRETSEDLVEVAALFHVWSQRNRRPGIRMMFGGKRPEPERNDPFRLVGEWESLEQEIWTTQSGQLDWWAGHPHPAVRRAVAAHETCPPDVLEHFRSMNGWRCDRPHMATTP